MACANIEMDIQDDEDSPCASRRDPPPVPKRIQYYQATEMLPDVKRPLHNLQRKQPAVLGSLQLMSGLFSIGVGIASASDQQLNHSLFTLFRVSMVTGVVYAFAGLVSNLLFKFPALLTVSIKINYGCIVLAAVAACLISVDLAQNELKDLFEVEVMVLCVLGIEVFLSVVLCFWYIKEKRAKSP